MIEPVFISSGYTYEKSEVLSHFLVNGCVDPLTNQSVDPNIILPN